MNKQNKISLTLGVLVLTVLIVTSSFAFFQITNTDSSTDTNFSGELEDIEDYGKSVLSGGIDNYHINILASDMSPSKIGTHYYGTIDKDSNYNLKRKNYEISNVSIDGGVDNENVEYTCTSELSITLNGTLADSNVLQTGDGKIYLSGDNLRIDAREIDLKELIESATENEEGIKEYKKNLTYIISKGNPGTLNVDFEIINREAIQNDIAGKNIKITLRNSNLQCEVSGKKVYAIVDIDSDSESYGNLYRSQEYRDKILSASFVNYIPSEEELTEKVANWDLSDTEQGTTKGSVIGWLEANKDKPDNYDLYIGSNDKIYVKTLSRSFDGMANLQEVKFNNLNTSEATNISRMLTGCNLSNIDLSTFDTHNIKFISTFIGDYKGTTLDLTNFDVSEVADIHSMFYGAENLVEIKGLENFDTSKVTDMSFMFFGCSKLTTLDLSNFDTSNVTTMISMFNGCQSLTNLDLSNFDTKQVNNMAYMFAGCNKLTTLNISNFKFENVIEGIDSTAGNYYTFVGIPASCEVKINKKQKEIFESKFPLGINYGDRKFTPTYVD